MKINDLNIGTKLFIGFSIILTFVAFLGGIAFRQSNKLWKNTDDLYTHPFQVARATRDFKFDILEMNYIISDMVVAKSEDELQSGLLKFKNREADIAKCFSITYDRYLGDKADIDTVYNLYQEWILYSNETIRLIINGQKASADLRNMPGSKGDLQTQNMIVHVQQLIDFAKNKADSFYSSAALEKKSLDKQLLIVFCIVLIISLVVGYLIIMGIRRPLLVLTEVANEFSLRKYHVRSDYIAKDEIGTLAKTFNSLASSVQDEVEIKENVAWISQIMMENNELRPFCQNLLKALHEKTESQIAAIYLLNREKMLFEHYESVGLSSDSLRSFNAEIREGEFGQVLAHKSIVKVSKIHDDTIFTFHVVSGTFRPKEILTIPVIDNGEVVAIISLSSLKEYSSLSLRLINDIWVTITARMLGVINFQKIKDFSSVLDLQNRELDQKSKEMIMQADELKEYNIELELQKKQLDEANKLKSAFLSNMSHELRTPLNSVIALSGVLSRRLDGKIPADEYNYLGIIERNGKNLLSLINDILDLSRIEAGREEVTYSSFSVYEIVRNILNSLETIAQEKGISTVCNIPADIPGIISDQTKCHHIFQNILSNAVKFTEKGSVEVSASVSGKNIIVVVKDSGIGIPEDFLPFIFDEFRQADDNASRKYVGTGLGLAIVKKYCNLLSGSIAVVSVQGKGSTFTVTLPFKPSVSQIESDGKPLQSATINTYYSTNSAIKTGAGKTLLIVEDSEPQIIQLKDILSAEGFVINVARNGREALETIKLSIPDAMILDLQMPEVDGFEVLRQIRELKETRNIPVLILTAKHITKAELSFLKENHIYQLIQKGAVNRNDLLSYVKNLIIPEVKTAPETIKPGKYSGKQITKASILVIEDNNDNLVTLRALLDSKYEIISASDGPEGLEKAVNNKPQMILVDISLPVMDGFKVLDEIKKIDDLSGIPVIALTARAMKGDRENILAYGFDGYIAKPVDSETFEKTISDFIDAL